MQERARLAVLQAAVEAAKKQEEEAATATDAVRLADLHKALEVLKKQEDEEQAKADAAHASAQALKTMEEAEKATLASIATTRRAEEAALTTIVQEATTIREDMAREECCATVCKAPPGSRRLLERGREQCDCSLCPVEASKPPQQPAQCCL